MHTESEASSEDWSTETLLEILRPLAQTEALIGTLPTTPTGSEPAHLILATFIAMKELKSKLEKRLEDLKPYFHSAAEKLGDKNELGNHVWQVGGNTLLREKRVATEPDADLLRALLKSYDIEIEKCFDEQPVLVLNVSKLKFLVDTGKLDGEKVEALKGVNYALKTTASPKLKAALDGIFKPKSKPKKTRERRK